MSRTASTHPLSVRPLTGVLAAWGMGAALLLSGCSASSAPTATSPAPQSPSVAPSTPPAAASSPAAPTPPTADELAATIKKGLLSNKEMKVVGLKVKSTTVVPSATAWSFACGVTLATDSDMLANGYQEWVTSAGGTRVLETVAAYPSGIASKALTEAAKATKACKQYAVGSLIFHLLGSTLKGDVLTFCQEGPNNFLCHRITVRGDFVTQVAAFGGTESAARQQADFVAGLAVPRLKAAGI